MTEPDSTRHDEFSKRLRQMVSQRDGDLVSVHGSYAEALASGAGGDDLYTGYLEQRGSVINNFTVDSIALREEYSQHDPTGLRPLPETPGPVPAFPRPGQPARAKSAPSTSAAPQLHSWQTPVPLINAKPHPVKTPARRGRVVLGIVAAGVAVIVLVLGLSTAGRPLTSSSSGSGTSSYTAVTTRTVTYEVVGGATGATITYQAPTGTAQASIKVPLTTKSGDKVTFEMDRGKFVYISAQNKGTSGNITCRISVDGTVISTVTSSGSYAIASCDGTVP